MPLLRGRGTPQRVRAPMRRQQRRALPDHPCRMNIPASSGRRRMGYNGPLKSDCPLECVRACRVCTGCRRDVDQSRRQIGIDVWIDGKTVRASRAHVPDHLCRCSHSLTAATVRRPRRPILSVGRQGGHSRVSRPSGCRAHRAGTSRGGSRALRHESVRAERWDGSPYGLAW